MAENNLSLCNDCHALLPWLNDLHPIRIPKFVDQMITLFAYRAPVDRLFTQLKFNNALSHSHIISQLLLKKLHEFYQDAEVLPNCIIPVPLHQKRIRTRGFNQALEIAKPIAKGLALPVDNTCCIRRKHTAAQTLVAANKRQANVHNAFSVIDFPGKYVAIVDDIVTTGSTISELSRSLRQAGVEKIDLWCGARSIL